MGLFDNKGRKTLKDHIGDDRIGYEESPPKKALGYLQRKASQVNQVRQNIIGSRKIKEAAGYIGREGGNWAKNSYNNRRSRNDARAVAREEGYVRGMRERGLHEGRGYKSRTQIMAERPPRYADGRGYGQGRAPRYRAEARRQYQEERREAYQAPQKPVDVLSSINSYESRVLGRKPKRR